MSSSFFVNNETGSALYIVADPTNGSTCSGPAPINSEFVNTLCICSGPYEGDLIATVSKNSDGTVTVIDNQEISPQGSIYHILITTRTSYDFAVNISKFSYDLTKQWQVVALTNNITSNFDNNNLVITYLNTEVANPVKTPFSGGVFGPNCKVTYSLQGGDYVRSLSNTCYVYLGYDYSNAPKDPNGPYAPQFPLKLSSDLNSVTCTGQISGGFVPNPFIQCPPPTSCVKLSLEPNLEPWFNISLPLANLEETCNILPINQYTWTGAAGDNQWDNPKNWLLNGAIPSLFPGQIAEPYSYCCEDNPTSDPVTYAGALFEGTTPLSITIASNVCVMTLTVNVKLQLTLEKAIIFRIGDFSWLALDTDNIVPASSIKSPLSLQIPSQSSVNFFSPSLTLDADVTFNMLDSDTLGSGIVPYVPNSLQNKGVITNLPSPPTIFVKTSTPNIGSNCGQDECKYFQFCGGHDVVNISISKCVDNEIHGNQPMPDKGGNMITVQQPNVTTVSCTSS